MAAAQAQRTHSGTVLALPPPPGRPLLGGCPAHRANGHGGPNLGAVPNGHALSNGHAAPNGHGTGTLHRVDTVRRIRSLGGGGGGPLPPPPNGDAPGGSGRRGAPAAAAPARHSRDAESPRRVAAPAAAVQDDAAPGHGAAARGGAAAAGSTTGSGPCHPAPPRAPGGPAHQGPPPAPPGEGATFFSHCPNAFFDCEGRPSMQSLIIEHEDVPVSAVTVDTQCGALPVYWCPRRAPLGCSGADVAGDFFVYVGANPAVLAAAKPYVLCVSVFSDGEDALAALPDDSLKELHVGVYYQLFSAGVLRKDAAFAYACLPPLTALVNDLFENALGMLEQYYSWYDNFFLWREVPAPDAGELAAQRRRTTDAVSFQTCVAPLMYLATVHSTIAEGAGSDSEEREAMGKARLVLSRLLRYLRECEFSDALRPAAHLYQVRASRALARLFVRMANAGGACGMLHGGLRADRLSAAAGLLREAAEEQQRAVDDALAGGEEDAAAAPLLEGLAETLEQLAEVYDQLPEGDAAQQRLSAARLRRRAASLATQVAAEAEAESAIPSGAVAPPTQPPTSGVGTAAAPTERTAAAAAGPPSPRGVGCVVTLSCPDTGCRGSFEVAPAADEEDSLATMRAGLGLAAGTPVQLRHAFTGAPARLRHGSVQQGAHYVVVPSEPPPGSGEKTIVLEYEGGPPEGRCFRVVDIDSEEETLARVREGLGLPPYTPVQIVEASTGMAVPLVCACVENGCRYTVVWRQ
eukprot:TRINITY_DN9236_c0_g1_i2.p1 TRINITY_DN9236_c0_g1~~TRINITY_DN9236_c0_g1_i2.p1  ORF type:complete len:747 (+),score=120.79 TRINITY_DN9236_c0_g1_i2:117-2357(+)